MDSEGFFIARPDLAQQMDRVFERCVHGGLQVVWLFGETGQGKTLFLQNYLEQSRIKALVSYAQCSSPIGSQSTTILKPHQPLKDAFESLLTNQASMRRKLNLIKNISLTVLAMIPIVGEFAYGVKEIRRDLNEFKNGTREVDFSNFVREYFDDLMRIAEESPVIIAIDDIQWSDVPTIEALYRFFTEVRYRSSRITLVLSTRRDELQGITELLSLYTESTQGDNCTELVVPPFTSLQLRDYYNLRFPASGRQPELYLWLEQKTGGNPFFLSSYIQHLLHVGIIDESGVVQGDLESYLGLPAEIRLVNSWLMKALDEEDLHLLLTASVLGYEFSLHELMHLTQRPTLELIRSLRRVKSNHGVLEQVGYKLINGKESTVYRFTQHAIHTALYNELTAEEKESLHRLTAHYLNDLRLLHGSDPDVQNSVASALMLHSRLGHEPELEYQSLLLKAQNTPDDLNEAEIHRQLAMLAPSIGIPIDQLLEAYRHAIQLSPIRTRMTHKEQVSISVPQEERETDSLSALLSRVLLMLKRGSTAEANVVLEMHINRAEKRRQFVHPVLHLLYALTGEMAGRGSDFALHSLRAAAGSDSHPSYAAFGKLGLALFDRGSDTDVLLRLREAAAYSGRHRGIVQAIIAWVITTRFSGKPEFVAILEQKQLDVHLSDYVRSAFPRTSSALQSGGA
jgi:hypothetical protein